VSRDEHKQSEYIEKLPPGKHSCKGIGRTVPNPAESLFIDDKLEVPIGKPIPSNVDDTSLLYNEYPFFILEKKILLCFYYFIISRQNIFSLYFKFVCSYYIKS
jgi:hypothetical protein